MSQKQTKRFCFLLDAKRNVKTVGLCSFRMDGIFRYNYISNRLYRRGFGAILFDAFTLNPF